MALRRRSLQALTSFELYDRLADQVAEDDVPGCIQQLASGVLGSLWKERDG